MSADSVGGDRQILTRLRSGDRKLQRWDNCIVKSGETRLSMP